MSNLPPLDKGWKTFVLGAALLLAAALASASWSSLQSRVSAMEPTVIRSETRIDSLKEQLDRMERTLDGLDEKVNRALSSPRR